MASYQYDPDALDYLYEEGRRRLREVVETVSEQERKIFVILSISLIVTGGVSIIGRFEFTGCSVSTIFSFLVIISSFIVLVISAWGVWPRSFEDGANIPWLVQWSKVGASVQNMKIEVLEKTFVDGFKKNERSLSHKGHCLKWLVPAAILQIACVIGLSAAQAFSQSGM